MLSKNEALVLMAKSHLGYKESYNNNTFYAEDFPGLQNNPWCAMFVSRLLRILNPSFPTSAKVQTIFEKMRLLGMVDSTKNYGGGNYRPNTGDLIFYSSKNSINNLDHIGVIEIISEKNGAYQITAIEGNYQNAVKRRNISSSDRYVCAFGRTDILLNK